MKKRKAISLLFFFFVGTFTTVANEGSFLIKNTPQYALWWSVGTYKVNKTEIPSVPKDIMISAARNEYEPFQLVVHPEEKMENLRVKVSSLSGENGSIDASNIKVYDVDYVYVRRPVIKGMAGWYPDPAPLNKGPLTLYPRENWPFLVDVYVPESTPAGTYNGKITLLWGTKNETVPFTLTVFNFTLPKTTTLRSSFGLNPQIIKQYHNLQTDQELKEVYDKYTEEMRACRIGPTSPFDLYPMKVNFTGIKWEGGVYDRSKKSEGVYSYKVADASLTQNVFAISREPVHLTPGAKYSLSWDVLCGGQQKYAVGVRFFNQEGNWLIYDNILKTFPGDSTWHHNSFDILRWPEDATGAVVVLYPSIPMGDGTTLGTAWFDDVKFTEEHQSGNLLAQGNFEVTPDQINVTVDFDEFDKAGARYLDEFGFNAFHLPIQGMGSGTFYSRQYGVLGGFEQNTPEYDKLMKRYLSQVESHLEKKGWLGKEYVYWFDEPHEADYPFVREGMNVLRSAAPKIKRFITEDNPGPKIMDITDISCSKWNKVRPEVVDSLVKTGKEFWSYLCTSPNPPYVNLFIDQDAINFRMWCWMSYQYKLSGILVWSANYWNSDVFSENGQLQNPWQDPMSYTTGYGTPLGQPNLWGNGDGRFFYPPNRDVNGDKHKFMEGPVRSLRLFILREGIEDYEYFVLLQRLRDKLNPRRDKEMIAKADALLHFNETFFTRGDQYTKNPLVLYERRKEIASLIETLQKK